MECSKFEAKLSDYFDHALPVKEAIQFRAHALQCRKCRALIDDVKASISACKDQREFEPSSRLEKLLAGIARDENALICSEFEELITEFLDGFVPAPVYHRFEEHAGRCERCSTLLTDVVYAVAACHSVHTFEEIEIPELLVARLIEVMPAREKSRARRVADRLTGMAEHLIPRPSQAARWTFATAASLALATFAVLIFGFSDDRSVSGIYRQANVKASELYTRGTDIYSQTDKVVARLERVGHGIGEFWDTLGGETKPDGAGRDASREPDANKRTQTSERN